MSVLSAARLKRIRSFGPELLVGLGLGANAAWVSMSFKSLTLYGNVASAGGSEPVLDAVYLISIATVCVTLSLAAAAERRTWMVLAHLPTYLALAVGTTITTLFMPLGSPGGSELQQIILVVTGVLSGLFSSLYLIYFGFALSQLTLPGKVLAAAASTIFSSVLCVAFNVLHPGLAIMLAAAMPLISAALTIAGMRRATLEVGTTGASMVSSPENIGFPGNFSTAILRSKPSPISNPAQKATWRGLVGRIAAASLLVGFANESSRTLYMQMDLVEAGQYAYAGVQAVDSLLATIAVVALALLLLLRRSSRMAKDCYFAICLLLTLGIVLLPAPGLFANVGSFIPLAVSSAAYSTFGMFIWILTACICSSFPQATIAAFASIRAAWAIGPLLGIVLGRAVLETMGLSPAGIYVITLCGIIALVVVSTFVFSSEDLGKIMAIVPTRTQQRFRHKCQLVAQRFGLTERESEIMMMLAKGRNLPFIQDQLYLSRSTVSTHRQHIYQKTGVHSQQELIDLVQEAE